MGLFGAYDPALIQQQREDQLTKEAYMASQGGGAYAPILNASYRLGNVAGGAIGRLFGMEDPVLKKAALADEATKAVQGLDINFNDPKQLYPAMIKELQKRGLTDMAMPLVKQYQDALSAESRMDYEKALADKAKEGYEYKQDMLGNITVLKNGQLVRQIPSQLMGTPQGTNIINGLPGTTKSSPTPSANTPYMFDDKGKIVPNPNYKKPE